QWYHRAAAGSINALVASARKTLSSASSAMPAAKNQVDIDRQPRHKATSATTAAHPAPVYASLTAVIIALSYSGLSCQVALSIAMITPNTPGEQWKTRVLETA